MRLAVVVGCLLGASAARADFFDEPVPGAVAPTTAPGVTIVDGVKVHMVSAVSKKSVAELEEHYHALFQRTGLYMADEVRDIQLQSSRQITAVDPDRMISYTVLLQPGKGTTTVMMSMAELARPPTPLTASFVPIMQGAQDVSSAQLEWMETLSYNVAATPAEIKAYYREQLKKMGYAEVEELSFVKQGERIALTVAPGLQMRGVMIVHERPGQGEAVEAPPVQPPPVKKTAGTKDGGK